MKHSQLILGLILLSVPGVYAQHWNLTGNAAAGTDFIGTINPRALVFKVNNQRAGLLEYNALFPNTTFGYQNLISNAGGKFNSAFGYGAMVSNIFGSYNTATGHHALYRNRDGGSNTATGYTALYSNTSGGSNTANGYGALYSNNTGKNNTATGKWAMFSNTMGYSNVAVGNSALQKNTVGHNLVAIGDSALFNQGIGYTVTDVDTGEPTGVYYYENTALGSKALFSNTSGYNNTATGFQSLFLNKTGADNTANGYYSLHANTTGSYNTAVGNFALQNNSVGRDNTSAGAFALGANKSGNQNSSFGYNALGQNTSGSYNTAVGYGTLSEITTQIRNTAVGWSAGAYHTSSSSTFLGHKASSEVDNVSNSMALGFLASVTASYQVRIGSGSVTSIGGQVGWSTLSDRRFKKDIRQNVPGLEFINKLKPVTYHLDVSGISKFLKEDRGEAVSTPESRASVDKGVMEKEKVVYTGFEAQEVEKAAKELGYEFSGVDAAKNENDLYGLRYAEFVVPLVKAVQELSQKNEELQKKLDKLKRSISFQSSNEQKTLQATSVAGASLNQNIPNPFAGSTIIPYTLPQKFNTAQVIIADQTGKVVKQLNVRGSGKGTLHVDAANLSSAAYSYSLLIDGNLIGTRKMILIK